MAGSTSRLKTNKIFTLTKRAAVATPMSFNLCMSLNACLVHVHSPPEHELNMGQTMLKYDAAVGTIIYSHGKCRRQLLPSDAVYIGP
jgi:hypothetical protein